jgi:hypothetical protein
MTAAQPLGDDQIEPRANNLRLGEPEDARRCRIPEADVAISIGVDDRIRAIDGETSEKTFRQIMVHIVAPNRLAMPNTVPPATNSGNGCSFGQ